MPIDHHAWKKLKLILKNKEKITKMICYTNAYEPRTENFLSYFAPKQGKMTKNKIWNHKCLSVEVPKHGKNYQK